MSDWHPEDIKALIRRRGETLASLGRKHGISRQMMANVLAQPNPRAEAVIAGFLNVDLQIIWPSRYHSDGRRRSPQPAVNYQRQTRFQPAAH